MASSISTAGRTRALLVALFTLAALVLVVIPTAPADALGPNAVRPDVEFTANVLPANDDGSTGLVPIGFPVNFGGSFTQLYVNNNGNVTFDFPLSTFTPFDLTATEQVIIAPFFGDVDTRGADDAVPFGSEVTYGQATVDGQPAFGVNWLDVDCYSASSVRGVRNFFQLVLIDRSGDTGNIGDFDIEFNYDQIQWETGTASDGDENCLGGFAARAGWSNASTAAFEIPGSGSPGAFLDSNPTFGLVNNSLNSPQPGRYVFEIRGGSGGGGNVILGNVFTNPGVSGALVQACSNGFCALAQTNPDGDFALLGLPDGTFNLTAFPPADSNLNPGNAGPFIVDSFFDVFVNIELTGPVPPPPGTGIEPSSTGGSGLPSVYWNDVLTLTTTGCPGGMATYDVVLGNGTSIASGDMAEGPPGTYTASVGPFFPDSGPATVFIEIDCPPFDGVPDQFVEFNIYIDPSGVVVDQLGNPIAGATVELFRSANSTGPFNSVPDGSAVMSPSNRTNPDTTDSLGRFRWDVIAGFYTVQAMAPDCWDPDNPSNPVVETDVLTIPPPALDLVLQMECLVTVLPPQDTKEAAAAALDALIPSGDDHADKHLQKALDELWDSIAPERWDDPFHVNTERVFKDERKAAKELEKAVEHGDLETLGEDVAPILDLLIEADRTLAQVAIDDAIFEGGDPDKIAKAEEEFAKAEEKLAEGDYDKAIKHYGKAWKEAGKA